MVARACSYLPSCLPLGTAISITTLPLQRHELQPRLLGCLLKLADLRLGCPHDLMHLHHGGMGRQGQDHTTKTAGQVNGRERAWSRKGAAVAAK